MNRFKKDVPQQSIVQTDAVGMFLKELSSDNQASQLDGLKHLQEMSDPRIVPALDSLLAHTRSDEVVEAIVTAISKQKDARAIPALRKAAAGVYDYFLQLTIAEAQLNVGDPQGFSTLIHILRADDAGYARHQANGLLERKSKQEFGYDPDAPVSANGQALKKMEDWYSDLPKRKNSRESESVSRRSE
jgi:HEAT repeat protein